MDVKQKVLNELQALQQQTDAMLVYKKQHMQQTLFNNDRTSIAKLQFLSNLLNRKVEEVNNEVNQPQVK
jgi:hypothetical protein